MMWMKVNKHTTKRPKVNQSLCFICRQIKRRPRRRRRPQRRETHNVEAHHHTDKFGPHSSSSRSSLSVALPEKIAEKSGSADCSSACQVHELQMSKMSSRWLLNLW